jgi:hypothetical protein
MNSIAAPFNLSEEIGKIVPNVFETMLALPANAGLRINQIVAH